MELLSLYEPRDGRCMCFGFSTTGHALCPVWSRSFQPLSRHNDEDIKREGSNAFDIVSKLPRLSNWNVEFGGIIRTT